MRERSEVDLMLDVLLFSWLTGWSTWFGFDVDAVESMDSSDGRILYLTGLLESFSVQDLTYPCDSLDAFAGVLGALETSFRGGFLFGLPESCSDIGLLW